MLCPSSLRCMDSNPRPSEHESPPITTRPGLPPLFLNIFKMRIQGFIPFLFNEGEANNLPILQI